MPARNGAERSVGDTARRLLGGALRRGGRGLGAAQQRLRPAPPSGSGTGGAPPRRTSPPPIGAAREAFFRELERTGDLGAAAATTVRAHLAIGAAARARAFSQVLQQLDGAVREAGDICMAMTAVTAELSDTAWALFTGVEQRAALRLAPAEYLRTAFGKDPDNAADALARLLRGDHPTTADAAAWLDIAHTSFVAGFEAPSRAALERAEAALGDAGDARGSGKTAAVRADIDWLRDWYGRREAAANPPADAPVVGVLSFRSPDRSRSSRNLGDYLESLAVLSLVTARCPEVSASGGLAAVVADLRERLGAGVPEPASGSGRLAVCTVDRDATAWSPTPPATWTFVTGALPGPVFGTPPALPFPARVRPVFLSVHVDSVETLTPDVLDYLRAHAPVGCRDRSTALLLAAAGVPAFVAGPVSLCLADVARRPAGEDAADRPALAVDIEGADTGAISQDGDAVRRRLPAANLRAALEHLDAVAGARSVRTGRLQTYLLARSLGVPVTFEPDNPASRRLFGLRDLDDVAVRDLRHNVGELVGVVLDALAHGATASADPAAEEEAVRAAWRAATAPLAARFAATRADVAPLPPPAIDVAAACATIRAASVTVERVDDSRTGREINVELSLDGNYKHQLEVVLDSIVVNTTRPVRAFVLCRDHTAADYERMAALFGEVSFVWLPTDRVDYGPIRGLLGYTTVATMDRLLLPDLLPEVTRIVHHDLDALCLWDLGELHDIDLAGTPLAGRMSPQQNHVSGFASLMRMAERFRREPELGNELLVRACARLQFDFDILNAGIMTLDLDRMRADGFCRNFLPYVERFGLNDQAVLNIYAGRNRVEVDPGWNWRPWLETLPEPKIAHWAGELKPWKQTWVVGRELWQAAEARVADRYARAGR